MKITLAFLVYFLILLINTSNAQTASSRNFDAGFQGMIGTSFNANSVAFNVGGPNFSYRFSEHVLLGLGAFPSLIITKGLAPVEGYPEPRIEPKLGIGPRLDMGNWVIFAPAFHFNTPQKWLYTFGFGYKFH